MNKRKLFSFLSILGILFIIFSAINVTKTVKTGGDRIENPLAVPQGFSRQFSAVTVKRRYEETPQATFLSPDNKRLSWKVLGNDYKLVNFWATWCAPCVLELPSLAKLSKRYEGKGLQVIPISIDIMRSHEQIKQFLDNRSIDGFAAYFDDAKEVQRNIPMRGIPTSILLDPQGRITHVFEGDADWTSPPAIAFFDALVQ